MPHSEPADTGNDAFVWTTSNDSARVTQGRPLGRPPNGQSAETLDAMHRRWLHHGPPATGTRPPRSPRRRYEPHIADLMAGVQLDEFFLEYQPIISLASGQLAGFEALLRWRHPRRGVLGPERFIDDAERSGALGLLTPLILHDACRAAERWNRTAGADSPIAVSVNLCGAQLYDPRLGEHVAAAIGHTGLAAERLWFEITENSAARHVLVNREAVHDLRRLGVKVALDDFGAGCASIGCLRGLPLDAVKMDRSLVVAAAAGSSGARVLAASTQMARALGLSVVAEGIERQDQLDCARRLGCDLGQGSYVTPPIGRRAADRMAATAPSASTTSRFNRLQIAHDTPCAAAVRTADAHNTHPSRC
jgi:EAL domain-containing protein (putative c-di-GMP-specific phosphodiesterase class I)